MDHRSFTLNFKSTPLFMTNKLPKIKTSFIDDLAVSSGLTKERYAKEVFGLNLKKVFHNYCHLYLIK